MKQLMVGLILGLAVTLTSEAQQPERGIRQRASQMVATSGQAPQTKNYQLELTMARGGKTARYRMVFSGGQISTDLVDKLAEGTGMGARTMSFSASLNPFDEGGGGEVQLFIGRALPYVIKSKDGKGQEREVVQEKTLGLTTKVALRPGKPVVVFDDEDEKITLKLMEI